LLQFASLKCATSILLSGNGRTRLVEPERFRCWTRRRHHGQRVHAGATGERGGDGRHCTRNAHEGWTEGSSFRSGSCAFATKRYQTLL